MLSSRELKKYTPRWEKNIAYSILDAGPPKYLRREKTMAAMMPYEPGRLSRHNDLEEHGSQRSETSTPKTTTSSVMINAAAQGDAETVRDVLENARLDPDGKRRYQARSALHLACGYGQLDVVKQLLQVSTCK